MLLAGVLGCTLRPGWRHSEGERKLGLVTGSEVVTRPSGYCVEEVIQPRLTGAVDSSNFFYEGVTLGPR